MLAAAHLEEIALPGIRAKRLAPADSPDVRGWQFFTPDENEVWIPDNPGEEVAVYLHALGHDLPIEIGQFVQSITALQALVAEAAKFAEERK